MCGYRLFERNNSSVFVSECTALAFDACVSYFVGYFVGVYNGHHIGGRSLLRTLRYRTELQHRELPRLYTRRPEYVYGGTA